MDISISLNLPVQGEPSATAQRGTENGVPTATFASTLAEAAGRQKSAAQGDNRQTAADGDLSQGDIELPDGIAIAVASANSPARPLNWDPLQMAERLDELAQQLRALASDSESELDVELNEDGLAASAAMPPGQWVATIATAMTDNGSTGEAAPDPMAGARVSTTAQGVAAPASEVTDTTAEALPTASAGENPADRDPPADGDSGRMRGFSDSALASRPDNAKAPGLAATGANAPGADTGEIGQALPRSDGNAAALTDMGNTAASRESRADMAVHQSTLRTAVSSPQWAADFSQRIVSLVQNNDHRVSLHLNPAALGPLTVDIDLADQQASFHFAAHSPQVRSALENAMPQLRDMLAEQGISLGETVVGEQRNGDQQPGLAGRRSQGREQGREQDNGPDHSPATAGQPIPIGNLPGEGINLYV